MMWRGLAIGLIISAPMGPVGILCIQRTLDKGRKAGFYTGVGAAISDLFYCLLTGFGLSFIEEFLERNSAIIQLLGSVVLIVFGIYLFKKNPARQLKKPAEPIVSTKKSILAGFLFTFSNPLILFLIIGLFARFNFLMPEIKIYHYFIGYIFIAAGALGWWWLVTFFIDKVRTHFNLRSMWLINKIIGVIILIFALVGIITGILDLTGGNKASAASPASPALEINPTRGYSRLGGDSLIKPGSRKTIVADAGELPFVLRLNADAGARPWSLALLDSDSEGLRLEFSTVEKSDGVSSEAVLRCNAFVGDSLTASAELPYGRNLAYGENLLIARRKGYTLAFTIGSHSQSPLLDVDMAQRSVVTIAISAGPKSPLAIYSLSLAVDRTRDPEALRSPWHSADLLRDYLSNSADPLEGYWRFLDSTTDTDLARVGGEYTLASVRSEEGYDLIYLDGARILPDLWTTGDVKAHLASTGIPDVWTVEWRDSSRRILRHNVKAQTEQSTILTVFFPFQNTSMRFHRIGAPE